MEGCDKYAVDSHIYQAWADDWPVVWFEERVCQDSFNLKYMESLGSNFRTVHSIVTINAICGSIGVPVVVGEWSLATNNCAMWLNGFNDNGESFRMMVFH